WHLTAQMDFLANNGAGGVSLFVQNLTQGGAETAVPGLQNVPMGSFSRSDFDHLLVRLQSGELSPFIDNLEVRIGNTGQNTTQESLTVTNVAPSIALNGSGETAEGSVYSLELGAITDPGDDTVTSIVVNWGDGTSNTYTTPGIVTHLYADGVSPQNEQSPVVTTISVNLTDEDGVHANAGVLDVVVRNVAPTASAGGPYIVDEGSSIALDASGSSDPGNDIVSYEWDFDYQNQNFTIDATGLTPTFNATQLPGGTTYSVAMRVTDSSGEWHLDVTEVTVRALNQPPSLSLTPVATALPEDADTSSRVAVAEIVITDEGQGVNLLSLSGADSNLFEIIGTTVFLKAGTVLDFETHPDLNVTVSVDDQTVGGTPDDSADFSLSITDVNERPLVELINRIESLPDDIDTSNGIRVADIVIHDDALGTNTLSLSGADADAFVISGNELRLRPGYSFDVLTNPNLDITVEVRDTTAAIRTYSAEGEFLAAAGPVVVESFETVSGSNLFALTTPNFEIIHTSAYGFSVLSSPSPYGTFATDGVRYLEEVSSNNEFHFFGFSQPLDAFGLFITDFGDFGNSSIPLRMTINDTLTVTVAEWGHPNGNLMYFGVTTEGAYTINDVKLFSGDAIGIDEVSLGMAAGTPADGSDSMVVHVITTNHAPTLELAPQTLSLPETTGTTQRVPVSEVLVLDDGRGENLLSLSGQNSDLFEIIGTTLYLKAGVLLDFET
ncbi:MAG: hypothetical protein KDA96_24860, partial [Planctomycetaceae bacterium]|nr:hypothetical protein [Planctomycetaceae bacterium]